MIASSPTTQDPSYINPNHRQEWLKSGVTPEIITANVQSLNEDAAIEVLLSEALGQVRGHGQQYCTLEVQRLLKRYTHVRDGGWWCSGEELEHLKKHAEQERYTKQINEYIAVHAITGQFKPDNPRQDQDGKSIRYEQPLKVATGVFLLTVPSKPRLWLELLADSKQALIIVEGTKKAGCLLTLGYIAIALPGITGAVRTKDREGNPCKSYLIPEIEAFATEGRPVYICFDQDVKPKTRAAVSKEIFKLGKLLKSKGCKVSVIEWDASLGKGCDDLVVGHGREVFDQAYQSAISFTQWMARVYCRLSYAPQLVIKRKLIGEIIIPEGIRLVCLKSAKGTGKTESLKQLVAEAHKRGQRVLILSHRVQLTQALCDRVGIRSIYELQKLSVEIGEVELQLYGMGICVDSAHAASQARFNAEDWKDALIIFDECEQVLWHLLNSETCKSDRVAILQEIKKLLSFALSSDTVGQVVLSDADLSDLSIDFVKGTAGQPGLMPWICLNTWKPAQGWKVYSYLQEENWLNALICHIEDGGNPLIQLDSQQLKGRYSTTNLEKLLSKKFPDKRILRIDSETLGLIGHPAFGAISKGLDTLLQGFDMSVASPSIETGVSIDIKGHFTSVWGLFRGAIPENSIRQFLSRLREPVERHIFVNTYGVGRIAGGYTYHSELLESNQAVASTQLRIIKDAALDEGEVDWRFFETALETWAKMAARINSGLVECRESVLWGLRDEGHTIIEVESANKADLKDLKTEVTENRDCNQEAYGEAVAATELISDKDAERLQSQTSHTPEDKLKLKKWEMQNLYQIPVTPELYLKDCDGWYPGLRLHYYLTTGREYLTERDRSKRDTLAHDGKIWIPDTSRSLLSNQVIGLEKLGFLPLLSKQSFCNTDQDLVEFQQRVFNSVRNIKRHLRITLKQGETPIETFKKFASKLSLSLKFSHRQGARGEQVRVYTLVGLSDGRNCVFQAWQQRDIARAEKQAESKMYQHDTVATSSNKDLLIPDLTTKQVTTEDTKNPPNQFQVGCEVLWGQWRQRWLIEAVEGAIARIRKIGGWDWDLATVPLVELEAAIALKFGVSKSSVEERASREGWSALREAKRLTDEQSPTEAPPSPKVPSKTSPQASRSLRFKPQELDSVQLVETAIAQLSAEVANIPGKSKEGCASALVRLIDLHHKLCPPTVADLAERAIELGVTPEQFVAELRRVWQERG